MVIYFFKGQNLEIFYFFKGCSRFGLSCSHHRVYNEVWAIYDLFCV
jgi:hypothetical protein